MTRPETSVEVVLRNGRVQTRLANGRLFKTHGLSRTAEYNIWKAMIHRCHDSKSKSYPDYGGRGIEVCRRWRDSVEAFIQDMGLRPSSRHTIERLNNSGHYDPSNCRWATRSEQGRNTRRSRSIEFRGRTWNFSALCEHVGIDMKIAHKRLARGWSVDRAFTPVARRRS